MSQFVITITDDQQTEYYRRRITHDDLNFVIQKIDQALSIKPRKQRRDAGKPRTEASGQPQLPV